MKKKKNGSMVMGGGGKSVVSGGGGGGTRVGGSTGNLSGVQPYAYVPLMSSKGGGGGGGRKFEAVMASTSKAARSAMKASKEHEKGRKRGRGE